MARIEARIRIAASPEEVFRALSDPEHLRAWFAEHAAVDLDAGRYEFWGRHTPGNPEPGLAGMRLTGLVPDRRLSYSWRLDGLETEVDFEITGGEDGTLLSLDHRHVDDERPWIAEAFWSMVLENLRAYLERGAPGLRYDFCGVPHGGVEISIDVEAGPDTVFGALIEPSQLDRYMSEGHAVVEPEIGGRYDVGWGAHGPVKILDLVPAMRLSYSWDGRDHDIGETIVTWRLEGSGGRTRLTLAHTGFAPDRVGLDFGMGWFDYLNRIKQMTEVGDSWRKPMVRVVDDRDIRDEGLYFPAAGIHEAVAGTQSRVTRQRPR